ncbi:MAG: DUF4129 domain-containing protein [Chloroflexi bacterium]|nr:DUF4129 domain-containing protein [Chloroflexota bacterium]
MGSWGENGRFQPWLLLSTFLLFGLVTQVAHAQNGRLTLPAYWETIAEIQNSLAAAEIEDTAVRTTAANRLAAISEIELQDGRIQAIDHSFLITQLQDETVSNDTLSTLFTAYSSSRHGWAGKTPLPLDEAALAAILSQSQFNYTPEEPNFLQKLWQDIRQRVEDFLLQLFPENSNLRLPLNNLILIIAALLLGIALAYALRGLIADFTADAALTAEDELNGEPLTADLALKRAQELSGEGDYRTAVRYLYLSSLLLLEERGLLRYDRSLTNYEYLRSVAHRPELAAILRDVIDVFDRVWYGFQLLEANEYEQYALRVATLKQQKEPR